MTEETATDDILDHCLSLQRALLASFSSSLSERRTWASAPDRRLPFEVWELICQDLYPSQLCRLSCVSRSLYIYVGSLKVWEKWFRKAYYTPLFDQKLQLFAGLPRERCYMRYMCAISLMVCEACGQMAQLQDNWLDSPWKAPLPWRSKLTAPAKLRMCGRCRVYTYDISIHDEPIPRVINRSYLTKTELMLRYDDVGKKTVRSITRRIDSQIPIKYHEGELWDIMRMRKGGTVGMNATEDSAREIRTRTWMRLAALLIE